jgi:hypothetical protein
MKGYITKEQCKNYIWKGWMKQEIFYKFGLGIYVLWEVYYSYWLLQYIKNKFNVLPLLLVL